MNQEMPNWCTNSLTLTGKKEWIDSLMKVSETDDKDIFMYLRPCMEDAEWYSENWYSWNCDNWGTKWDANEVDVSLQRSSQDSAHYNPTTSLLGVSPS